MNILQSFQKKYGTLLLHLFKPDAKLVNHAMQGISSLLLGAFIQKGQTAEGANALMGTFISSKLGNNSLIDNDLLQDEQQIQQVATEGHSILHLLLENQLEYAQKAVSDYSDMDVQTASSVMKIAAPLVMNLIGEQVATKGLDATGLMNFLGTQQPHVKAALPDALSNIGNELGFSNWNFESFDNEKNITTIMDNKSTSAQNSESKTINLNFLKWLIPLILLVGVVGYFATKGGDKKPTETNDTTTSPVENNDTEASTNTADVAAADLKSVTLPGGQEISFVKGSICDQLVTFFNADEPDMSQGFVFDGLTFQEGSDQITSDSDTVVNNVAALLDTYQDFNVRIEGQVEDSGDAKADKILSANRTKALKAALITQKIDAKRIETSGKGVGTNQIKIFFTE